MFTISSPLPLFGNPYFHEQLSSGALCFDDQSLWRCLEVILLPGTVISASEGAVCTISTPAYRSSSPLYTLSELIISDPYQLGPAPSLSQFFDTIHTCLGVPYLWGGNIPTGLRALQDLYPAHPRDPRSAQVYELRGVDCSGLIYYASRALTARNSGDLIHQGTAVTEISALAPGMLIGWKGHVLIVTDRGIIESQPQKGVILSDTRQKMRSLLDERTFLKQWPVAPASQPSFVIRDLRSLFEISN